MRWLKKGMMNERAFCRSLDVAARRTSWELRRLLRDRFKAEQGVEVVID